MLDLTDPCPRCHGSPILRYGDKLWVCPECVADGEPIPLLAALVSENADLQEELDYQRLATETARLLVGDLWERAV
jgi:hypothetical protein